MSNLEIIHAYRKLLRAGLHAVQFSKPARYAVVSQLRAGFRDPHGQLNRDRVERTVWFLNAAAKERGLEHKIIKNLARVHQERAIEASRVPGLWSMVLKQQEKKKKTPRDNVKETAYWHYHTTITMLNDTMGLCLR